MAADRYPNLLDEVCDDPDDQESDYGRGHAAGYAKASKLIEHIERRLTDVEARIAAGDVGV